MNFVENALKYKPALDHETIEKLQKLEEWDFSQLIKDMSPHLLLEEGRLFSIEQLVPVLLHFAQEYPAVKKVARQALLPWLNEEPYYQQRSVLTEEEIQQACNTIEPIVHTIATEFKRFVAISLIEPYQVHAPSGPIDMFWHFLILHTTEYEHFCKEVWGGHEFDKVLEN